jgi:hypothetical protein
MRELGKCAGSNVGTCLLAFAMSGVLGLVSARLQLIQPGGARVISGNSFGSLGLRNSRIGCR